MKYNTNNPWIPSNPYQNLWGHYEIGEGTKLGAFVDIAGKVGDNCTVQAFVSIPPGIEIGDNVFIGPGARFANDKHPQSKGGWEMRKTVVKSGASIGMNASIGPGITIGENAIIGMGAVVLKDVPDGETWVGNPAHVLHLLTRNDV